MAGRKISSRRRNTRNRSGRDSGGTGLSQRLRDRCSSRLSDHRSRLSHSDTWLGNRNTWLSYHRTRLRDRRGLSNRTRLSKSGRTGNWLCDNRLSLLNWNVIRSDRSLHHLLSGGDRLQRRWIRLSDRCRECIGVAGQSARINVGPLRSWLRKRNHRYRAPRSSPLWCRIRRLGISLH